MTQSPDFVGAAQRGEVASASIRARQIRMAFERLLGLIAAGVALAVLLIWATRAAIPPIVQLAWVSLYAGVSVLQLLLLGVYRWVNHPDGHPRLWGRSLSLLSLFSGSVWGAAGMGCLLFEVGSPALVGLVLVAHAGLAALALNTLFPAFLGVVLTSLLPPAGMALLQGSDPGLLLGGVLIFVAAALLAGTYRLGRQLRHALAGGLQNVELVRRLTTAKQQAENARQEALRSNNSLTRQIAERQSAELRLRRQEQELSRIIDDLQDTFFRANERGELLRVSTAAEQLLGHQPEGLLGKPLDSFFMDQTVFADLKRALDARFGELEGFEVALRHSDGSRVWGSINAHYYRDQHGHIAGVEGTIRDITSRKQVEAELHQAKEEVEAILRSIGDAVFTTDIEGRIQYLNPAAESLVGWAAKEAQGRPFSGLVQLVDEELSQPLIDPVGRCVQEGRPMSLRSDASLPTGDRSVLYSMEIAVTPMRDPAGVITGVVMVLHDVSELRGLARQMTYEAAHDALTGLLNRRGFEKAVETALEEVEQTDTEHTLFYIDLDEFKIINDSCGHKAGDELLKQIAAQIRSSVRERDLTARLGGDEFAVLLRWCPVERAREIADSLRNIVANYRFVWEDQIFRVAASIGVVSITSGGETLDSVMNAGDAACYAAKEAGRNRVHVLDNTEERSTLRGRSSEWAARIRQALNNNDFELHVQPITALAGTPVSMGEVLVRLRSEEGELVLPAAFFGAAERHGLLAEIDRWVVRHTLKGMGDPGSRLGRDIATLSINLSGQALADDGLVDEIAHMIDEAAVQPSRLFFEIPESVVLSNIVKAESLMNDLEKIGCGVAIDDVGSSLTTVGYLKRLRLSVVKLDATYTRGLTHDDIDRSALSFLNEVGHIAGAITVAKGVEDDAALALVREIGIDWAQGFHLAHPRVAA